MQPRYFGFLNDSRWRLLLKGAEPTGTAIVRFASEVEAVRALKDFRDVYLRKRKIEATLDFTDFSQRIQRVHKPIAVDRYRLPLRFF
ncbi:hypothetical protein BBBOND_0111300 [Babesia bigemina]|uniref:RRM domain-containing protein n=1 Tax=Babesia bigemina TaxID=5866 RepID=A0A061D466_BABBI|nr:hypothetical protein BBBOND_0111300 [Babesia bigemina]CDR94832.1 hypothetical protein BBBOND_0111300 [Babesia bigemina]|eukprot:XP_012767018.1 hypothetical protein BBBOND_0111300 [Babesia bigemina]